jgi:hypothetical protein
MMRYAQKPRPSRAKPQSFTEWLKDNPPPDLQALCAVPDPETGLPRGMGRVPAQELDQHERDTKAWQQRLKFRHLD